MLYSKKIQLKLKTSMSYAQDILKKNTYPYCGSDKKNYDFIGDINNNSFKIKTALNGPRELFRVVVEGNFQYSNDSDTNFIANLKLSAETWSFILFFNSFLILLSLVFAIFEMTKIFIPIIMICIVNIVFVLVAHSIFNTTKQLIGRIYNLIII